MVLNMLISAAAQYEFAGQCPTVWNSVNTSSAYGLANDCIRNGGGHWRHYSVSASMHLLSGLILFSNANLECEQHRGICKISKPIINGRRQLDCGNTFRGPDK